MIKSIKKLIILSIFFVCGMASSAFAYEEGDFIFRFGWATVQPNDDSDPLALNGTELSDLGLGLPRTEVQVEDDSQLGLTLSYMFNTDWGLELLASTPFKHDIQAEALGVQAGETKHLPPTLVVQYYPMDGNSVVQPYIGVGLNYTHFFDEEVDDELNTALAGLGATGDADLSLDDSIGLALQAGIDYQVNDRWIVNGTIWYIDLDTTAEINAPSLGRLKTDVSIDPWVFMLGAGYLF